MQEGVKVENKEEFRKFWILACKKNGLNKDLQAAVWKHLQAVKCDCPEKFKEGLISFGFKIK